MHRDEVQIGMRVRRINYSAAKAPEGIIGVVIGKSELNSERFIVQPEDTQFPAWAWNCVNMEFVSAGPVPSGTYAEASQASAPRGRKDDSGKLDMNLLDDMPRALKAITEVMQWAITEKKPEPYKRASWLGVHPDRYRAAIKRHDREACEMATQMATLDDARYQRDKETNLLHLAHMACSAMMALENTLRDMEVYKK